MMAITERLCVVVYDNTLRYRKETSHDSERDNLRYRNETRTIQMHLSVHRACVLFVSCLCLGLTSAFRMTFFKSWIQCGSVGGVAQDAAAVGPAGVTAPRAGRVHDGARRCRAGAGRTHRGPARFGLDSCGVDFAFSEFSPKTM